MGIERARAPSPSPSNAITAIKTIIIIQFKCVALILDAAATAAAPFSDTIHYLIHNHQTNTIYIIIRNSKMMP